MFEMLLTVLIGLPDDIGRNLLETWIELQDVGRLDSAFCNRIIRAMWKGTFYVRNATFSTSQLAKMLTWAHSRRHIQSAMIEWTARRGIGLRGVCMTSEVVTRNLLAGKGRLVKCITIASYNSDLNVSTALAYTCATCPNVETLICSGGFNPDDILTMCKTWPSLQHIGYDGKLSAESVYALTHNLKRLRSISFEWPCACGILSQLWESFFKRHGNYLEHVSLYHLCRRCHTVMLGMIAKFCPNLKSCDFHYIEVQNSLIAKMCEIYARCKRINNFAVAIHGEKYEDLKRLTPLLPILTSLSMVCSADITDAQMEQLLSHGSNLRYIKFEYCHQLGDGTAAAIGKYCSQLQRLVFRGNPDTPRTRGLSDTGMKAVASGCPLLQHLDITGSRVTDAGIKVLLLLAPRLITLRLTFVELNEPALRCLKVECTHLRCKLSCCRIALRNVRSQLRAQAAAAGSVLCVEDSCGCTKHLTLL